jgi:hypothetical protein
LFLKDSFVAAPQRLSKFRRPGGFEGLWIERYNASLCLIVCCRTHAPRKRRVFAHQLIYDAQTGPIKVRVATQLDARLSRFFMGFLAWDLEPVA